MAAADNSHPASLSVLLQEHHNFPPKNHGGRQFEEECGDLQDPQADKVSHRGARVSAEDERVSPYIDSPAHLSAALNDLAIVLLVDN